MIPRLTIALLACSLVLLSTGCRREAEETPPATGTTAAPGTGAPAAGQPSAMPEDVKERIRQGGAPIR